MSAALEATSRGYQTRKEGNLHAARQHYAEAARLYREQDKVLAYAHTIRHIADIYQQERDAVQAKPLYEEALEIYRSSLNTKLLDLANTVRPYAHLVEEEGESTLATKLWEEARNPYASLRIEQGVAECNRHICLLEQS